MIKLMFIWIATLGLLVAAVAGAYWWSNVPPNRPADVSGNAVFLWAAHLGLPAPKHGTWIECFPDAGDGVNKCKLTEMDGTPEYEGVFLTDRGKKSVAQSDLKIDNEATSDTTHWVRLGGVKGAPLVFLQNGIVLIPKDAYAEGVARLDELRKTQSGKP